MIPIQFDSLIYLSGIRLLASRLPDYPPRTGLTSGKIDPLGLNYCCLLQQVSAEMWCFISGSGLLFFNMGDHVAAFLQYLLLLNRRSVVLSCFICSCGTLSLVCEVR